MSFLKYIFHLCFLLNYFYLLFFIFILYHNSLRIIQLL
nr:MAG TPA: hypothetical protein [Caudoviricetes sp.]